jgi:hypothetical protein
MGVDVARGGGNYNSWVMRTGNYATQLAKNQDPDLMNTVGATITLSNSNEINKRNVFVDDTGVGAGVFDRLREQMHYVNKVTLGGKANNETKFVNRRAENYWKLKEWINIGGKLNVDQDWTELLDIKYRADSSGRLVIMSKDDMRKSGVESPDVADSLMLTFDKPPYSKLAEELELRKENESMDLYEKYDVI